MTVRIVVADDHPIVLQAVAGLLAREPEFEVLETCATGASALRAVREHRPDVLVADHSMPDMTGTALTRELRGVGLDTRVLILAAQLSRDDIRGALDAGIRVLVLKEAAPDLLVEAVRKAHAGQYWVQESLLGAVLAAPPEDGSPGDQLTAREHEVLQAATKGLSNRRIARQLKISQSTVKVHLHNIYRKLDVQNRVQLVLHAHSAGLVDDEEGAAGPERGGPEEV